MRNAPEILSKGHFNLEVEVLGLIGLHACSALVLTRARLLPIIAVIYKNIFLTLWMSVGHKLGLDGLCQAFTLRA